MKTYNLKTKGLFYMIVCVSEIVVESRDETL